MANFTYIENAHVFSKAPVQLNMEASSAVNKSVHTVQSNEIWGEVCPFITKESIKDLKEDTLFEIDGYAPVKFNYKKPAIVLDAINNNGMKSNGYVAKVIIDNKPITQFIADTDVTDATGKLATGYRAVLYDKTGGEVADSKYTINYSNGLIYFKEPIESTLDSHYTLSFFTYEGAKLDTTITNIKSSINETKDDLSSHASDTDIHITADERSKWNSAVQDVTSGNAYLERGTDNDNITLTLNVDTNLNDGATTNSVPSSAAVTSYGSSIISVHEAKKDGNQNIHVTETDRSSWDTAATKAGTAIQTVKRADDSSTLITVDQSETSVSIALSDTIATKDELSSHTSDTDIHITADERSKWNIASQKTDRLTFPTTYTNFYDNQYYVNSYGFEYVKLIEDAWIQNIEVSVVLPELRDSLTEINLASDSTITPNIIGEKVCKILVVEGLRDDHYVSAGNFIQDEDEIELGTSEYNICEKDKNNSLLVTLNFTFDQPIFLKANKDYRFYFYDRNENLYALPIIVNIDDINNITNNRKEVASRNLYTRYDYFGVWGNANAGVPSPCAPYGLKVKLSKDIYSAFVAHENNNSIHITENERETWNNSWENAISEEKYTITEYDKISGDYTTFVLPYNIVPVGSSINTVKLEITKGTPDTSAYLGAGLLFTDGSTKLLRVSNNAESISSRGILTWYFDEALELEENSRFVFYLLKNKEDFISPHPLVSSDVRICSRAARVVPGSDYSSWDNVISNLDYGFIANAVNLEAGNYNYMWDEYPVCTLSKIHHVNNDIRHFKEGEHEQLFSDEKVIFDSEKNVLDTDKGNYYGIQYKPSETFEFNKISIVRDPAAAQIGNKYLFIFKQEGESKVFVQKCITRPGSSIENNICYWKFEPTLLEKNISYFLIFRENEIEEYSKSVVILQALKQSSARESLYFIDNNDQEISSSYVPNIKIYGEGRLFATIDEVEVHTSDNIIHLTPEEKTTVVSLKSTNINNLYDETNNVTTVSNKTITLSDGTTAEFNPENIISAQYTFRTTSFRGEDTNDDNAPNANSKLTAFNLRTIYTSTNGAITEGGRYDVVSDGIELYKANDGNYYYRSSDPVDYEQDLLWKDDEEYETLGTLVNGTGMFMRNKIEVFNDDLTCLTTAKGMFGTNRQLADFKSPLPSLVNAKSMFTGCRKLKNWRIKLPSLVIGANMFSDINYKMELQTVDTCLPNLTVARQMFAGCSNLTSFHVPSTSFSNLYDAREMFIGCPITSINGNFESLEDGTNMLPNAHLDLVSIQNIAKTIRNWSNGYPAGTNEDGSLKTVVPTISLGIGLDYVEGDSNVIAVEAELDKIREKGWNVPVIWNGPSTISTLDETNKTFFARLCDSGAFNTHIDENGKPCSIITTDSLMWISDKDSWSQMVSSLEEAEAYFKLTKIEKVEESTDEII